jgi:hypothetical protein
MSEPRRIGEILHPALDRLEHSESGRAYGAWARATGAQVAGGARAKAFNRGVLTVECSSSVWAGELTYLSDQIMRRMRELTPDHPVERLRFMVARGRAKQVDEAPAPKQDKDEERPPAPDLGAARAQAQDVRDERLRAAILAALQRRASPPPRVPGDGAV